MNKWLVIIFFSLNIPLIGSDTLSTFMEPTGEKYLLGEIIVIGNEKTKESIITRELTFYGEIFIYERQLNYHVQRSQENLNNTSLFNIVDIHYEFDTLDHNKKEINFTIKVQERWYLWPNPIFEMADRNFNVWIKEQNWNRVNYGLDLRWNNFTGRKDRFQATAIMGYKEKYSISYSNPYIDKSQKIGLMASVKVNRQQEIIYNTYNDKPLYFNVNSGYARLSIHPHVNLSYRPQLYDHHLLALSYNMFSVADTIISINPDYFGQPNPEVSFISANYVFSRDMKDSYVYPLKGYSLKFSLSNIGLGINSINNIFTESSFIYFFPFWDKFYFGSGLKGRLVITQQFPYFLSGTLGYNESFIGYENYVIDGQDYIFNKNVLKYELIAPKNIKVDFIDNPKFNKAFYALYLDLNIDAAFVYSPDSHDGNSLNNELLYGVGLGVDFVTYYDIVIGAGYKINKFGEHGFYIRWGSPFLNW